MTPSARDSTAALDLTREELWVIHTAVLAHLKREAAQDRPATAALGLLQRLERDPGTEFDVDDLELVRTVLVEYLADAPLRDRAACRNVLDEVRTVLR